MYDGLDCTHIKARASLALRHLESRCYSLKLESRAPTQGRFPLPLCIFVCVGGGFWCCLLFWVLLFFVCVCACVCLSIMCMLYPGTARDNLLQYDDLRAVLLGRHASGHQDHRQVPLLLTRHHARRVAQRRRKHLRWSGERSRGLQPT